MYNHPMKKLLLPLSIGLFFTACSTTQTPSPTQNDALHNVSKSTASKKEDGAMQRALDNWLTNEWTPTVEANEEIKAKNEDNKRAFTLQEYVEKAEVYSKAKKEKEEDNEKKESHADEMRKLPGIGATE